MKQKLVLMIVIVLVLDLLTACDLRTAPPQSVIAPPFTPSAELLQAAEIAAAEAVQPAPPWLLIERRELGPLAGSTILGAFPRDGADALPPESLVVHSATEPIIARDEAGGVWRITFKQ